MAYRMAKVSLNTQTASLAVDFKSSNMNIAIISVHPGDVPTDLSHHQGDTDIVESVNGILTILEGLNLDGSGQFLHYTGEKMNW
jgi:NAD(P)-dependent dehydrogenase (short-subunit alcohol dehydrogenase family)